MPDAAKCRDIDLHHGKYLAEMSDNWSHSHLARTPDLGELTSFIKVPPHAAAEFACKAWTLRGMAELAAKEAICDRSCLVGSDDYGAADISPPGLQQLCARHRGLCAG